MINRLVNERRQTDNLKELSRPLERLTDPDEAAECRSQRRGEILPVLVRRRRVITVLESP